MSLRWFIRSNSSLWWALDVLLDQTLPCSEPQIGYWPKLQHVVSLRWVTGPNCCLQWASGGLLDQTVARGELQMGTCAKLCPAVSIRVNMKQPSHTQLHKAFRNYPDSDSILIPSKPVLCSTYCHYLKSNILYIWREWVILQWYFWLTHGNVQCSEYVCHALIFLLVRSICSACLHIVYHLYFVCKKYIVKTSSRPHLHDFNFTEWQKQKTNTGTCQGFIFVFEASKYLHCKEITSSLPQV